LEGAAELLRGQDARVEPLQVCCAPRPRDLKRIGYKPGKPECEQLASASVVFVERNAHTAINAEVLKNPVGSNAPLFILVVVPTPNRKN
jgi:hypothetical protein